MANQAFLDNILAPDPPSPQPVSTSVPPGSPQTDLILCASVEDQFAGDSVFESCTSGSSNQEETESQSAPCPNVKMSCSDIQDLTPEQKHASELARADKANKQKEQRKKQIARAREERQIIAIQEAQIKEKKQRQHPKHIQYRDNTAPSRTSSTARYHEPQRRTHKPPRPHSSHQSRLREQSFHHPIAHLDEWQDRDLSRGRLNLELTLLTLYPCS